MEKSLIGSVAQIVHDGVTDTLFEIVEGINTAKARKYSLVGLVYQQMLEDELASLKEIYGEEVTDEVIKLVSKRLK